MHCLMKELPQPHAQGKEQSQIRWLHCGSLDLTSRWRQLTGERPMLAQTGVHETIKGVRWLVLKTQ
jgi:hypothetical protein